MHLLACKPEFMKHAAPSLANIPSSILENEPAIGLRRDSRIDSNQEAGLLLEENKESKHLEVSEGSYIEFYKNGVKQSR